MDRRRLVEGLKYDLDQFQLEAALPARALFELAKIPDAEIKQHVTDRGQRHLIEQAERIGRRDAATLRSLAMLSEVTFVIGHATVFRTAVSSEANEYADAEINPKASQRSLTSVVRMLDPTRFAEALAVEVKDFVNEVTPCAENLGDYLSAEKSDDLLLEQAGFLAGATEKLVNNLKLLHSNYALAARLHKHVTANGK